MYVLCAGKNLHRFAALAVIQHANPQVVAVGMTVNFHNLTGDYTLQALAQLGNGVNLQADTGNFIAQLRNGDVNIYILF